MGGGGGGTDGQKGQDGVKLGITKNVSGELGKWRDTHSLRPPLLDPIYQLVIFRALAVQTRPLQCLAGLALDPDCSQKLAGCKVSEQKPTPLAQSHH